MQSAKIIHQAPVLQARVDSHSTDDSEAIRAELLDKCVELSDEQSYLAVRCLDFLRKMGDRKVSTRTVSDAMGCTSREGLSRCMRVLKALEGKGMVASCRQGESVHWSLVENPVEDEVLPSGVRIRRDASRGVAEFVITEGHKRRTVSKAVGLRQLTPELQARTEEQILGMWAKMSGGSPVPCPVLSSVRDAKESARKEPAGYGVHGLGVPVPPHVGGMRGASIRGRRRR